MSRQHNFSAGPGALPLPALEEARAALRELPGAGASIVEISHRSPQFEVIMAEAEANLRALLGIGDDYAVLFLQGGAQQQFALIPINFLAGSDRCAEYVVSGYWSRKAYREAELEGCSAVLWDGAGDDYRRLPGATELVLDGPRRAAAAYVHYTANETIQGTQLPDFPEFGAVPTICDVSSEFLSRPLPMPRLHMVYASAQKNLGPAGLTLVIVHRELLRRRCRRAASDAGLRGAGGGGFSAQHAAGVRDLPHAAGDALAARRNRGPGGDGRAQPAQGTGGVRRYRRGRRVLPRPRRGRKPVVDERHLPPGRIRRSKAASWRGRPPPTASGLRGHRSVGGLRASLYNAVTLDSCRHLAEFMADFARRHG